MSRPAEHLTRWIFIVLLAVVSASCGSSPPKRAQPGATPIERDIEPALRGLIGSLASVRGREPLLVTGYGIVVGLKGTGSSDMPVNVRAFMEREMVARGVGQATMGFGDVSPRQMLNDLNTAVVQVQAAIPPGAPSGTTFDVFVRALPGTSTTSLEGGRLWTTDLFRGNFIPGGPATRSLAKAAGPVFINPFADPAGGAIDSISRTEGRILGGGRASEQLDLILTLDSPSHARSRSVVTAINARFQQDPGDRLATAIGRNEEIIEINIPKRFKDDTDEFLQLLLHSRVDQAFPQEWAVRYGQALREQPELADSLSWAMQALGPAALPELRRLYDYPELTPRLAALQAGAGLEDPLVAPHLIELAETGPPALRTRAIALLGGLKPNPTINLALRRLLEETELDVRVAAYEALRVRFDPAIERFDAEGKFLLEVAPFGDEMIYVTQQGEPRLVVFGAKAEITRPLFVSAWDDRLMLNADAASDEEVRVYYRDHATGKTLVGSAGAALPRFIRYLAHTTTPEAPAPGLGLSYSEVVGALHELWKADGFSGVFVAEQDRLIADLLRTVRTVSAGDRPETDDDPGEPSEFAPPPVGTESTVPAAPAQPRSLVVPLKKPDKSGP